MKPQTTSQSGLTTKSLAMYSVIYLAVPVLIFILGWIRLVYSILLVTLLVGLLFWIICENRRKQPSEMQRVHLIFMRIPQISVVSILLIIWLGLSGIGGFGYQNPDYAANNALFRELIEQKWPPLLDREQHSDPIVYYIAYFLPAALVGKLFNWQAANFFLLFWSFCGLWLCFAWFVQVTSLHIRTIRIYMLLILFCLCGGLDLLPAFLKYGSNLSFGGHYEIWASFVQYSSQTTLLFWVPQHAIAGWIVTGLVVTSWKSMKAVRYLGIVLSCLVLWSPFTLIGLLPFLVLIGIDWLRSHTWKKLPMASWMMNFFALPIGIVLILYLGANRFQFPVGFLWQKIPPQVLRRILPIFYLVEFWLLSGLLLVLYHKRKSKSTLQREWLSLFWTSIATLIFLPLFFVGYQNDLVMRASIPSLFVFWSLLGGLLTDQISLSTKAKSAFLVLTILLVIIGFFPAITEVFRSVNNFHFGAPPLINFLEDENVNQVITYLQRVGNPNAFFFRVLGK